MLLNVLDLINNGLDTEKTHKRHCKQKETGNKGKH